MRLDQIQAVIEQTTDRRRLRLLNRAWWREYFREKGRNETQDSREAAADRIPFRFGHEPSRALLSDEAPL